MPEGVARDRFRGCLVGLAIGDALGAAAEFMSYLEVADVHGVLRDYHATMHFDPGEFTDDTSMALAMAESIIEVGVVDIKAIAGAFVNWMQTDGRGIGNLTYQALSLIEGGASPLRAGRKAWEASGRTSAGNGAVMRCAPVGLLHVHDPKALVKDSVATSWITHYDPRCCWSCVAVNAAISAIIRRQPDPIGAAMRAIRRKCAELEESLADSLTEGLEYMHLDGPDMGYTILTTRAAFSALRQFDSFEEGVVAVVNKGGDADTNACVAGALLGAKYGFEDLPKRWVDGLLDLDRVLSAADGIYDLARN